MKRITLKRRITTLIAGLGLLASGLVIASAPSAQASTLGNDVCVARTSNTKNSVRTANASFSIFSIYKAHCSSEYPSQNNQVQAFYVHAADHCESYWGYWYKSSRWYFFQSNNNTLTLYCNTIYEGNGWGTPPEEGPPPLPPGEGTDPIETIPTDEPFDPVAYSKPSIFSALPTGNAIINHVEPSNYVIYVSQKNPYASPIYNAYPQGGRVNNAQCFKPALTSHSYWGGIYWGGQIYCFQSSNNVLTLYSGLP